MLRIEVAPVDPTRPQATSEAIQADGRIVVGGYQFAASNPDFWVARYNQDGTPDPTFGTNGQVTTDFSGKFDFLYAVAIQGDGKIVAAGVAYDATTLTFSDFGLARYQVTGPAITSVTPSALGQGATQWVTIAGSGFL